MRPSLVHRRRTLGALRIAREGDLARDGDRRGVPDGASPAQRRGPGGAHQGGTRAKEARARRPRRPSLRRVHRPERRRPARPETHDHPPGQHRPVLQPGVLALPRRVLSTAHQRGHVQRSRGPHRRAHRRRGRLHRNSGHHRRSARAHGTVPTLSHRRTRARRGRHRQV